MYFIIIFMGYYHVRSLDKYYNINLILYSRENIVWLRIAPWSSMLHIQCYNTSTEHDISSEIRGTFPNMGISKQQCYRQEVLLWNVHSVAELCCLWPVSHDYSPRPRGCQIQNNLAHKHSVLQPLKPANTLDQLRLHYTLCPPHPLSKSYMIRAMFKGLGGYAPWAGL